MQRLCEQNAAKQAALKDELAEAQRALEAAQYSGEDSAAAGKAQLAACQERAGAASARLAAAKLEAEAAAKLAAVMAAGIDNIADKLHSGEVHDHSVAHAAGHRATRGRRRAGAAGARGRAAQGACGGHRQPQGRAGGHARRGRVLPASPPDPQLFSIVQLPTHNARVPLSSTLRDADGV